MKKYVIYITEEYNYDLGISANSKKEALEKAKRIYHNIDGKGKDYCFSAEATTHDKTTFKVMRSD